jgi:exosortase
VALSAVVWAYWSPIVALVGDWQSNDDYSVGALVPLAALYLVWHRRNSLRGCTVIPSRWGMGVILVALAARLCGEVFHCEWAVRYSLVVTVAGLVLLIAGRQVFWRLVWVLVFLFLMVPLPGQVHDLVNGALRGFATRSATFLLEVVGVAVGREGNTIGLDGGVKLLIAEACSGLRMLTAFVVVAATMALLLKGPAWKQIAVVISSIPIAVACNSARILVTAILYLHTSSKVAESFFHDFAGLSMMPLAVLLILVELWLFGRFVVQDRPTAGIRRASRRGVAGGGCPRPARASERLPGDEGPPECGRGI